MSLPPSSRVSLATARRIALGAQRLAAPRRSTAVGRPQIRRILSATGLLQIDSVNVAVRAHEMPLFSRLGPYPVDLLYRMAYQPRRRELFEYWAHEASYLPVGMHPLLRWRMARAEKGETWGGLARFARERPAFIAQVLAEVEARGPTRAGDLEAGPRVRKNAMWDWSDAKKALEWLFWTGRLSVAERVRFERRYDLVERVLPPEALAAPTPSEAEAHRALLQLSARSHGIGTAKDLADYYRLPIRLARQRLAELVQDGTLACVTVQGWREPAYLHPDAARPRQARGAALLSPFDPVVWERSRAERLFGFHYRIEIYVPASQRRWGYYVLPFLLGDRLAARVDLKADRTEGLLRVQAAYAEDDVDSEEVAPALAAELSTMAEWLGLSGVAVQLRGDLAPALHAAVRA